MDDPEIYDVAIIGAGPAGTSVAWALRDIELSTILIDKSEFPRSKPCAGVLPPRIYSELEIPEEIRERDLNGYRLHSPSGLLVESTFSKPGLIVDRNKFDDYLVKRLDLQLIHDNVSSLKNHKEYIELKGKNGSYNAKIVVGADGVNSIVRKSIDESLSVIAMAGQYEISMPKNEIDNNIGNWFNVYYTIPYGYGWLSPLKDCVKVGVGGVSEELKKNPKKVLDRFLEQTNVKEKLVGGKIQNFELHRIPMAGPSNKLTADRMLLVGDAGGFVYPGTGEGVYYALKSGRLAGETVLWAFREQRFDQQFLEMVYNEKLKASGLLSLRDVDFIEKVLSSTENVEKYLKKIKKIIH